MSVFIKFDPEDMENVKSGVRELKDKMINVNSSTIDVKRNIREKREILNQSFLTLNAAHAELIKIIETMPKVASVPLRLQQGHFIDPREHHETLMKLSDKISKLR